MKLCIKVVQYLSHKLSFRTNFVWPHHSSHISSYSIIPLRNAEGCDLGTFLNWNIDANLYMSDWNWPLGKLNTINLSLKHLVSQAQIRSQAISNDFGQNTRNHYNLYNCTVTSKSPVAFPIFLSLIISKELGISSEQMFNIN